MKELMKFVTPSGMFDFSTATPEEFLYAFENIELFPSSKKLSQKTIDAYKGDLEDLKSFLETEGYNLKQMNVWIIDDYVAMLNATFAARSVKRKLTTFKRLLHFGHQYKFYEHPFKQNVITPKTPQRHMIEGENGTVRVREMDLTTANLIIEAMSNMVATKRVVAEKLKLRNKILGEFLLKTGMRASEVVELKWGNIHKAKNDKTYNVTFLGKGKKSRTIPLQDDLIELLEELKKADGLLTSDISNRAIFINYYHGSKGEENKPISYETLYKLVVKAVNHVIKEVTKINNGISPHWFRHTFITTALEQDIPLIYVRDLAGHTDIQTTNIYAERVKNRALEEKVQGLRFTN